MAIADDIELTPFPMIKVRAGDSLGTVEEFYEQIMDGADPGWRGRESYYYISFACCETGEFLGGTIVLAKPGDKVWKIIRSKGLAPDAPGDVESIVTPAVGIPPEDAIDRLLSLEELKWLFPDMQLIETGEWPH